VNVLAQADLRVNHALGPNKNTVNLKPVILDVENIIAALFLSLEAHDYTKLTVAQITIGCEIIAGTFFS
jgi:hypothetical protein